MKFLTTDECEEFAGRLGRIKDVLDREKLTRMTKRIDFLYKSPLDSAAEVAATLASFVGDFSTALLWSHGLVFGDRTQEPGIKGPWADYARWRKKLGAPATLGAMPGQLFDATEQDALVEGIKFMIWTGPDCIIIPSPTRMMFHLSHDDLISIHCRSTPSDLRKLEALGLRLFSRARN